MENFTPDDCFSFSLKVWSLISPTELVRWNIKGKLDTVPNSDITTVSDFYTENIMTQKSNLVSHFKVLVYHSSEAVKTFDPQWIREICWLFQIDQNTREDFNLTSDGEFNAIKSLVLGKVHGKWGGSKSRDEAFSVREHS